MDTIVNELVKILKGESDILAKEVAATAFMKQVQCQIVEEAFAKLDDSLIQEQKEKGNRIEKKSVRTVVTTLGELRLTRRRHLDQEGSGVYPLDECMGWTRYTRYSTLLVRNLGELATKLTYRSAAKAVELLAPFSVSHQKINLLVNQAGQNLKQQQTSDQRYDALEKSKTAPEVLYLEGDGFILKGRGNKWFEVHRYQVCEGVRETGKNRKERIQARDFVSHDRLVAMKELMEYLGNTYDLKKTVIISDGGAGYTKGVFEELCGTAARHEFSLDAYHVNKKSKNALGSPENCMNPSCTLCGGIMIDQR